MKAHRDFVLRVPTTHRGKAFIEDLRTYLNKDTYKLGKLRYSGKRATNFGGHTRMADADSIRVYVKDKRVEDIQQVRQLVNELEHFKHRADVAETKIVQLKKILNS